MLGNGGHPVPQAEGITVSPEGVSFEVGPILLSINARGQPEAVLIDDALPNADTPLKSLALHALAVTAAMKCANVLECARADFISIALRANTVATQVGIDFDNDPEALERFEGAPGYAALVAEVERLLT